MNAGEQITPTLRLTRLLGKGAMGSVWVADHLALGTEVAVKLMSASYAYDPELVERFRREAKAAAQIRSPHVAQVFDHGVTKENEPYIVMELLDGEDLRSRLSRLGPLPPVEVARIVRQVARALQRAHQLGIVHRDIKPENIFLLDVEGEPFVKVLDFGIAKQPAEANVGMTGAGSILGTPSYMSPEQLLSSKDVDLKADLWALAVVAYEALTGELPFRGETLGGVSVTVNAGLFSPPTALRPELSPAIDVWTWRALQRDPEARFASAREMAEAFEQAVSGSVRSSMPSFQDSTRPSLPPPELLNRSIRQEATVAQAVSKPPPPQSDPPRISPSGAPGRTFSGIATTGHDGLRARPTALLASVAAGLVISGVLVGLALRRPTAGVSPTAELSATQATMGAVATAMRPEPVTTPDVPPPLGKSPSEAASTAQVPAPANASSSASAPVTDRPGAAPQARGALRTSNTAPVGSVAQAPPASRPGRANLQATSRERGDSKAGQRLLPVPERPNF